MRVAYLIGAHSQPLHLRRLIDRLVTTNSHAFVHIDAKSDLHRFLHLERAGVTLCQHRVSVYWGEFSLVEAALVLLREALSAEQSYDYFVLLSGSDYPLCPAAYIEEFLRRHAGREFINMVAMPSAAANKSLSRLTDYQVPSGRLFTLPIKAARRVLRSLRLLPRERNYRTALKELAPYGGSQWWTLSRDACTYLLKLIEMRPEVVKFFRNSWFSDEVFFQTLIANSPFRRQVRRNLMYTDWRSGGAHPAPMSEAHLRRFAAPVVQAADVYGTGEVLFARKFSEQNAELLDRLDAIIDRKLMNWAASRTPSNAGAGRDGLEATY